MSLSNMVDVTCPSCEKTSGYKIWKSINTTIDPEMKQAVRDGSAFMFTCPHCGKKTHVEYGFLYHQMEDEMMIYVVSAEDEIQLALDAINDERLAEMRRDFNIKSHYLNRVVVTQIALREKLAIFDSGLDDHIVEMCKLLLLANYQQDHPNVKSIELLYFQSPDGRRGVEIFVDDRAVGAFEFPNEMYEAIRADLQSKLKDMRDDEPLIDRKWALQMLEKLGEQ